MEIPYNNNYYNLNLVLFSCAIILVLIWAWRILNWVWFKPKMLEKCLRQQGFKGNSYKFLFGDVKEMMKMGKEALSKPIDFSHDMTWPRVMPFFHKTINNYGMYSTLITAGFEVYKFRTMRFMTDIIHNCFL